MPNSLYYKISDRDDLHEINIWILRNPHLNNLFYIPREPVRPWIKHGYIN